MHLEAPGNLHWHPRALWDSLPRTSCENVQILVSHVGHNGDFLWAGFGGFLRKMLGKATKSFVWGGSFDNAVA